MTAVPQPEFSNISSLGSDLKALRKARGLTLSELSLMLGRSVGWLSQVERGITQPSISNLLVMADKLEVNVSFFFGHPEKNTINAAEKGLIVRSGSRRVLGNAEEGLEEELLSPDLDGSFEIIQSTFLPGSECSQARQRDTEEAAYIISGRLDIFVNDTWHTLNAGDSIRLKGQRHKWRNPYDAPAIAIWVITPPVY
jgi:transcriptional regulator with XRE-family HTH domain